MQGWITVQKILSRKCLTRPNIWRADTKNLGYPEPSGELLDQLHSSPETSTKGRISHSPRLTQQFTTGSQENQEPNAAQDMLLIPLDLARLPQGISRSNYTASISGAACKQDTGMHASAQTC